MRRPRLQRDLLGAIALAALASEAAQGGSPLFVDSGQSLVSFQGNDSRDVALGDLDGDLDLDAFVAQGGPGVPQPNVIWENTGGGVFQEGAALGNEVSRGVALGDLDGDGDLDAFVAGDGGARVWVNQGSEPGGTEGDFVDSGQVLGGDSGDVALGELDATPGLDAVIVNRQGGVSQVAQVWWNDGAGTFAAGPVLGAGGSIGAGVATAEPDFDIVTSGTQPGSLEGVVLHENQGGGVFGAGPTQALEGVAQRVALGDLDGDTDLDVAVASLSAVTIFWNEAGVLAAGPALATPAAVDVVIVDLDGDLDADLVVANGQIAVTAYPNQVFEQTAPGTFVDTGQSLGLHGTRAIALGQLDGMAGLDAFFANSGENQVWLGGGEPPGPDEVDWQIEVVAARGSQGQGASLALDAEGRPHVSYVSFGSGGVARGDHLRFASWDGVAWTFEVIDSALKIGDDHLRPGVGDTALALDSSGAPHVVYATSGTGGGLRYATRREGSWQIEVIPEVPDSKGANPHLALALDAQDRPHVVYADGGEGSTSTSGPTPGFLAYAHFDGSSWLAEVVDSERVAGLDLSLVATRKAASIAVGSDGEPRIAYDTVGTDGTIRYARRTGAGWELESTGAQAHSNDEGPISLALDSGDEPHVAYPDAASGAVGYLTRGPGGWTSLPVAPGTPTLGLSLALDAAGAPHIAWAGDAVLRYARLDGSDWRIEDVDASNPRVGQAASLAVDAAGVPHVAYFDATFRDLRHASPAPRWQTVPVPGPADPTSVDIALAEDTPAIAYYDTGGGQVELADWVGAWGLDPRAFVTNPTGVSLVRDDHGLPQLAYVDEAGRLIHARRGSDGTWTELVVDDTGEPRHPQLVLAGSTGSLARIAWFDAATLQVKLARIDAGVLSEIAVNTLGPVLDAASGALSATVLVAGDVGVFYRDAVLGDLRFALWDVATRAFVTDELVDGAVTDAGRLSSAGTDGTIGSAVVAFSDDTNGTVRYGWQEGEAWQLQDALATGPVAHLDLALSLASREHALIAYAAAGSDIVRFVRLRGGFWFGEIAAQAEGALDSVALAAGPRPRIAFGDGTLQHVFRSATVDLAPELEFSYEHFDRYNPMDACRSVLGLFFPSDDDDRSRRPRGAIRPEPGSLGDQAVFAGLATRFSRSTEGERYLGLYGDHGSEMGRLGLEDPQLLYDGWGTLHNFMEGNEALVTGRGDEVVITQEMADQALDLWTRLRDVGSPALASAIDAELARWNDMQDFVGMTFARWELEVGVTGNEICGNCEDDDGNGLVDFEDPACCGGLAPIALELQKARIKPRGSESQISLKARLATVEGLDPSQQDVFVQLASETGPLLCAELPSEAFRVGKRKFKFKDKKGEVPGALGIRSLTLSEKKKDGSGRLKLSGRNVAFETPPAGPLAVTLGVRDPGGVMSHRCAAVTETFREKSKGKLAAP